MALGLSALGLGFRVEGTISLYLLLQGVRLMCICWFNVFEDLLGEPRGLSPSTL